MKETQFAGPTWNNTDEYVSIDDPKMQQDLKLIKSTISELEDLSYKLKRFVPKAGRFTPPETNSIVPVMQEVYRKSQDVRILIGNISTYASTRVVVNGNDNEAKNLQNKAADMSSTVNQVTKPLELIIAKASNDTITKYLKDEVVKHSKYSVERMRDLSDTNLSTAEEELIVALGTNGFDSWFTLYNNLSGTIKCNVELDGEVKQMGLAATSGLLEESDVELRKKAYYGINSAWTQHKETCAAALNSLAGTRQQIYKRRSHTKKVHFLDQSLHQSRIQKETLEAIMSAVEKNKSLGQRTMKAQAKALGLNALGPWDRFVPAPDLGGSESKISFASACGLIKDSFQTIHPEMAEFVQMMQDKQWIEGSVGDAKRPGAFCTKFPKSRNPRVYMTYSGGMNDVLTLAHELGHAFHNWKLKDIPRAQSEYPLTLAETASIFSETVVNEAMEKMTNSSKDLFKVQWNVAREAEGLLLNVASRFTFEKAFYEKRQEGFVNADDLTHLMKDHWQEWYGDALSEVDPMFWCSKLHFYISGVSFYNYPYIFGYLFALGVYAQKEKQGDDFYPSYIRLLQDTGRMSAEEVAMKHLKVDLTNEDFWQDGINIVRSKVDAFENAVHELF